MSIPTQPTPTTIATEAYQLYARRNPTSAEITRVTDYGLEIIKSDLMDRGISWDFLRTVSYQPVTQYVSSYQMPTDYKKLISVRLLEGSRTGTAQAATSTTLTLAASDGGGSETPGKWIVILSATAGANQALQVKTYDSSTKVATMETSWTTTPTGTIIYLVVDSFKNLPINTVYDRTLLRYPHTQAEPTEVFHLADSAEGDLILNSAPDKTTYVLEESYYADLLKMDIDTSANPRYARILRLLNGLLIQGVYTWLTQTDSRYTIQRQIYDRKLVETEGQYLYPNNESNLAIRLDY